MSRGALALLGDHAPEPEEAAEARSLAALGELSRRPAYWLDASGRVLTANRRARSEPSGVPSWALAALRAVDAGGCADANACRLGSSVVLVMKKRDSARPPAIDWAAHGFSRGLADVADGMSRGLSDKEIAAELERPLATVRVYSSRILKRLDLRRRVEIIAWARAVRARAPAAANSVVPLPPGGDDDLLAAMRSLLGPITSVEGVATVLDAFPEPAWLMDEGGQTIHRNEPAAPIVQPAGCAEPSRVDARSPVRHCVVAGGRTLNLLLLRDAFAEVALEGASPVAPLLTPALAAVAELLAEGLSAEEIARRTGRPLCTVRTYVARIYARTGAHSQAEFVARIERARRS